MTVRRRALAPTLLALVLAGCLGAGSKHFRAGEKAYASGDLEEADRAYSEALKAEPSNTEYGGARKRVRAELAKKHIADARAKEQSADWSGASASWARAAELSPDEAEFPVRRDLSALKAQNLGPDEWYVGVEKIATQHTGSDIAQRSLAGARAAAYQHNVNLGEQYLSASEGARAYTYFTRAKEIDPSTPGMRFDSWQRAEALSIAERAAQARAGGDPITAYELYQEAYAKMPLPEIKAALANVKSEASAILSKLDAARAHAERGRYDKALAIYESMLGKTGVPASIEAEIGKVRNEMVKSHTDKASQLSDKGDLKRAHRELVEAMKAAGIGKVSADVLAAGLELARDGEPARGLVNIDQAGLPDDSILLDASQAFALASARQVLDRAKRLSKRDGAKALSMIASLDPFEPDLPGISELRRELRAGSFAELIDEALRSAKAGNDGEAASLILAALNASQAPAAMRDPAARGADQLRSGSYADSERSFSEALTAAPRSRLAQRGVDIARLRRHAAEEQSVDTLRKGQGNLTRAVETLEAALSLEPSSAQAKKGADALMDLVKKGDGKTDRELGDLIGFAARLGGAPAAARESIGTGADRLREGDLPAAEKAFDKALAAAPTAELAKLGREASKKRMLASLRGDAKNVAEGDEDSAGALAELLARNPNDPEAKAALAGLLAKAKSEGERKNDAEAARFMTLATVAVAPAPGVKLALEKGNAALAKGDLSEAESAYSEALDLEPESAVAKTGFDLAKGARVGALQAAVEEAKRGNVEPVKGALAKAIAMDPNSADAKRAYSALLDEARKQGEAGNDAQAAALLDAANVVSKPETVKQTLERANGLLRESKLEEAELAFAKVLEGGDSQVARAGRDISRDRRLSGLISALKELETGGDETRGAQAAAELRKIDPAHAKVAAAVEAALTRAEQRAASGDDKAAARSLTAVAVALGEESVTAEAVSLFEAGKYEQAEAAFTQMSKSELGRRGSALARNKKLGTLKAGLSGEGRSAALAIKALLDVDPNNAEAKKAFAKLLSDAEKASKAGDDRAAAENLELANVAAGAPEDLTATVKIGTTHMSEKRYAEAERAFRDAAEIASTSQIATTGLSLSKTSREKQEKDAVKALSSSGDPRPHATILAASLIVEPQSKVVSKAYDDLVARARRSAAKGLDADTAQELEAAVMLENTGAEQVKAVTDATALYAKSSFGEAEAAFAKASEGQARPSRVAKLGEELSRARRVAMLRIEFETAKKDKDVLRQARVAKQILELDPNDKAAQVAAKSLEGQVVENRVETARTHAAQGKLGVAWVYLTRALTLDENDKSAKAELETIEKKLGERLDLIMMVEEVERADGLSPTVCQGFDSMFRDELMTQASRETTLGGYVLSPDWTQAYLNKDARAPNVSGAVKIQMSKCQITSGTANATFEWAVLTPRDGGDAIAKGKLEAVLPRGVIPVDEQDGAGKNARKAFSKRAAQQMTEALSGAQAENARWLLTLAEHAQAKGDVVLAADAYARLMVKKPRGISPKRMEVMENYLKEQLQ